MTVRRRSFGRPVSSLLGTWSPAACLTDRHNWYDWPGVGVHLSRPDRVTQPFMPATVSPLVAPEKLGGFLAQPDDIRQRWRLLAGASRTASPKLRAKDRHHDERNPSGTGTAMGRLVRRCPSGCRVGDHDRVGLRQPGDGGRKTGQGLTGQLLDHQFAQLPVGDEGPRRNRV